LQEETFRQSGCQVGISTLVVWIVTTRFLHGVAPAVAPDSIAIRQFPAPVRRSRLASWWQAWRAVRGGASARDYLAYRQAQYLSLAPQNRHPLPSIVTVHDEGRLLVEENPDAERHPLARLLDDPAGVREADAADPFEAQVRWVRATREARAQQIARELEEREEETGRLTAHLLETTERLGDLEARAQEAIAAGAVAIPATAARTPEERGRPVLRFPWRLFGQGAAIVLFLLLEGYQLGVPYLDSIGVDTTRLGASLDLGLATGLGFAAVAIASIFVLAEWALQLGRAALRGGDSCTVRLASGLAALGLAALVVAIAHGIGQMRHGLADASQLFLAASHGAFRAAGSSPASTGGGYLFFLLTVAVPIAVLRIAESMRRAAAGRQKIREAQRAWDADEERRKESRDRLGELVRRVQEARQGLEAERERAREKVRALNVEAQAAEQEIRNQVEAERRYAAAFAGSLVAALEQDRHYFLRHAHRKVSQRVLEPLEAPPAFPPSEEQSGIVVRGVLRRASGAADLASGARSPARHRGEGQ
jgi:hypothetical protein